MGSTRIQNGNIKLAKKNALENALISAINQFYYSEAYSSGLLIPKVDKNYLRFINRYIILNDAIESNNIYKITLQVNVDALGLADAVIFNKEPTNSVIFAYSGIDYIYINREIMDTNFRKELLGKQFTLDDQDQFDYNIQNSNDTNIMLTNFNDLNSKYFFRFEFTPRFSSLKDSANLCELTTKVTVHSKINRDISLKIETVSKNKNPQLCMEETVNFSINQISNYIRRNIIKPDIILDKEYKYNLIAKNFSNMVVINDFLSTLKDRSYIINSAVKSFTPNEIIIELNSFLDTKMLSKKISFLFSNQSLYITNTSTNIVIDFGN